MHSRVEAPITAGMAAHLRPASDPAPQTFAVGEVVAALSHALDLTEGQPPGHARRSCLIALRLADVLALPPGERTSLYYAMLLKDAGCSSSAARMAEIFAADDLELKRIAKRIDWASPRAAIGMVVREAGRSDSSLVRARRVLTALRDMAREGNLAVETRCDRGARIVTMLEFPDAAADTVRYLDEHWDGRGQPYRLRGDAIPILARIACLSQTAEVFAAQDGLEAARAMVRMRRGRWFDPAVADAFLALPDSDPLFADLAADRFAAAPADGGLVSADDARIDRIAEAFASMIDAKSPFTASHSDRVARYAVGIGRELRWGERELRDLRRAGLLHDIGKLGVSNAILDKPGRLTAAEYDAVKEHPRNTEAILRHVPIFAPLAGPAGAHHERVDGRGYHRGLAGEQIPVVSRVLACADVYDALTARRPYRDPMPSADALDLMRRDVGAAFFAEPFAALCAHVAALPLAA
jgi:HD-GYP domain-containing protein (c-di-GMP phosphodiesterase class II)